MKVFLLCIVSTQTCLRSRVFVEYLGVVLETLLPCLSRCLSELKGAEAYGGSQIKWWVLAHISSNKQNSG